MLHKNHGIICGGILIKIGNGSLYISFILCVEVVGGFNSEVQSQLLCDLWQSISKKDRMGCFVIKRFARVIVGFFMDSKLFAVICGNG
jgi:hypothetical protein